MKYIYALIDPRDKQVRYIGQTDDLPKRLQQHIADKSNSPKSLWIRDLGASGLHPSIVQLATVADDENTFYAEHRWIYFGRKNGWNLTNTTAMKSEEYYSLQGYFERLIVEMEKPADVPAKQYSGEDVKQELLALVVKALKGFQSVGGNVSGMFSLASTNVAFSIVGILICMASSTIGNQSNPIIQVVGGVSAFSIAVFCVLFFMLGSATEAKTAEEKESVTLVLKRGFRLVGSICLVVALFPFLFGGA